MMLWSILACIILVLGIAPCMLSSQISQAEEVLAHNAMARGECIVKITARRLESQGKRRYAQLFELIYPDGVEEGVKGYEHRTAVERRLAAFEMRGEEVLVRCIDCGKHFMVYDWNIANALIEKRTIECGSCGKLSSALPVYRRREIKEAQP